MLSLRKRIYFWLAGNLFVSLVLTIIGTLLIFKLYPYNFVILLWFYSIQIILCIAINLYISKKLINIVVLPVKQIARYFSNLARNGLEIEPIYIKNYALEIMPLFNELTKVIELLRNRENERQLAEKSLKYNEMKYREMADFLPQSVFEASETGIINYVNKTWHSVFGYTKQDILAGMNLTDILKSADDTQINSSENFVGFECIGIRKDKSELNVILYTSRITRNNKHFGFRCLVVDHTERKRQIEELEKARKKAEESDRIKLAFLANMSHEVRTPMNGILGFAELLCKKDLDRETRLEYITHIKKSGELLLKMIDDIIDIARIEAGELKIDAKKCELNSLLDNLLSMFEKIREQKGKNIELVLFKDYVNPDFIIYTDPERLNQVMINLINNAIKFTNVGKVEFGYSVFQEMVQFYVKDTGIGIPKNMHEAIFDRFRQVENPRFGGTGLGLTISKNIVQLLGGRIWLQSEEGIGSTFYFTIPCHQKPTNNKPLKEKNINLDKSPIQGETILVVTHIDAEYSKLEKMLTYVGAKPSRAFDGKEAIRMCSMNFDLVIMEMGIPLIDGFIATKQIKRLRPTLPIIGFIANESDSNKCFEAGCNGFLLKPLDKNNLLSKVFICLHDQNAFAE